MINVVKGVVTGVAAGLKSRQRLMPVRWLAGAIVAGFCFPSSALADYSTHAQAGAFVEEMVATHGFSAAEVTGWLAGAERKQAILDAISRPAEKVKPWHEYRQIFVTADRTEKGVEFWRQHRETLARAEAVYGVPAEIIVSIIGVETRYGRHTGSYRVIDALATLAFDYPARSPFFRKELQQYLLLAREQKQDPLALKGSYAGAMGYGQFMPSSYRAYAVDFDNDGLVDIWNNPVDAIGSVANYFRAHGWQPGAAVVSQTTLNKTNDRTLAEGPLELRYTVADLTRGGFTPAENYAADAEAMLIRLDGKQGEEFWMGLKNFYVITRYNRSTMYAMSVYQLSQDLAAATKDMRQARRAQGQGVDAS